MKNAKPERVIQNEIRLALSNGDTRLLRQQAGNLWAGEATKLRDGSVLIRNPRRVEVGFPGLSDLGGWTTVTVTPDMVGRRVAVYLAVEVKTPRGRVSDEQETFIALVRAAGGRAGVARSVEDAEKIIAGLTVA